jgi:hypothetical protein
MIDAVFGARKLGRTSVKKRPLCLDEMAGVGIAGSRRAPRPRLTASDHTQRLSHLVEIERLPQQAPCAELARAPIGVHRRRHQDERDRSERSIVELRAPELRRP